MKSGGAGVKNEHAERLMAEEDVNEDVVEDGSALDGLDAIEVLVDDLRTGSWVRPDDGVWRASLSESGLSAQGDRKLVLGLGRAEEELGEADG